ncbi:MAG TPA: hypothetical protein VFE85_02835 [Woeseiaceae bacterium]|nr:hypothetical protein [Woeseiaceae bacterium]
MSTRHHLSDFEDVDDVTYRMLDSRFCKVAMHGQRHEPLRHRRNTEQSESAGSGHRFKRVRERNVYE